MEEYIINKNRIKTDALNYENLRRYGIDYITKLGNKLWTDHNIHDPGITTLELLCYALTDLGYRTSFNIKDILTPRMGKGPEIQDTFIPADQILSSSPITKEDFRKWILEHIPMVRNAWIEKQEDNILTVPKECLPGGKNVKLKGFYNVTVDMEEMNFLKKYRTTFGKKPNGEFVSQATYENDMERFCRHYIRNSLLKQRNLCENITDIKILKKVYVGICVDVEINPAIKYEPIIIEIGKRVSDYISPAIPVDKKTQLNPSDIMNLIMSIDGVINVRHLHFMVKDEDMKDKIISVSDSESIRLVNNDYAFRFYNDFEKSKEESLNDIIITRGLLSFKPEIGFSQTDSEALVRERAGTEMKLTLPQGTNREIDEYISIQDEFPKTYKLGQEGIADNETDLRKAQRLQFKAYLLFFDQLLADYLMQLHSVKDIFSWKEGADSTYFIKNLSDEEIADFSKVFAEYEGYKEIVEPEALRLDRRNRFLNHLIARFNEEFVDYSILTEFIGFWKFILNGYIFVYFTISTLRQG
ncbi:hypothetical protein AGMMS50239_39890 [Bacteroidia bacterium]|nr:hypothetical protein AGMMS50239_39890 [Bacteroidia bacterium]